MFHLISSDAANPGSVSAETRIGRRNVEGGGRSADFEHTNFRSVIGAKGDLGAAWDYDAYMQHYYTQFFSANQKFFNFASIGNALQVKGTAANPVCISGPPCVRYDIFSDGGVSQNQLNYLYLTGTGAGSTTLRTLHADVTGKLGEYGIKSPLANDGVGVNVGWESRNESVKFTPDSAELSGQLSGFGSAAVAIDNNVTVSEEFLELRAPLVQEQPGIKDLVLGSGIRRSDYSVSGIVNTFKFDLQYAPIEDVRFRASFNRAIRAPSIIELYNPQLVGLIQLGNKNRLYQGRLLTAANAYNFSAALLQAPKFDATASNAMNYGAIGAIFGHEVSHFVDPLGADYDVHGAMRHWWTQQDRTQFARSSAVLINQFSHYRPFPDLPVSGTLTLRENVADVGGLAAAFDAYRGTLGDKATDKNFVRQQDRQFFIGFARAWRVMTSDDALRTQISDNDHAPEKFRVSTVRNLDAWYDAFDVGPEQRLFLAPSARVRIW